MKLITVRVKIHFEDDNGKPKSRKENYLINAADFKDAIDLITAEFNGSGETWEIVNMNPSSIIAVINLDGGAKITRKPVDSMIQEKVLTND